MEEAVRTLGPLAFLGVLCLFAAQQAQAQKPDQVPYPMPPVIDGPPEESARLTEPYSAAILEETEFPRGDTRPTQGFIRIDFAAQERCAEAPVEVTASSADERRLACSAASDALQLLGRCKISPRRPLQVHILSEVRHPFSGPILGLFDTKQERVLVTQPANIAALVRGTPHEVIPESDFYRSLIVHEIIHGVLHQNLKRPATSHAAYEYPAYALQIESLPPSVRDKFLRSFMGENVATNDFMFSDSVLFFDPFFFAARAYEHFKASPDGCAHLQALLEGEVSFILTMPLR
jgi:hypothetical protein